MNESVENPPTVATVAKLGEVEDGECDICSYFDNKTTQKVREDKETELKLCKPCYVSMAAIER